MKLSFGTTFSSSVPLWEQLGSAIGAASPQAWALPVKKAQAKEDTFSTLDLPPYEGNDADNSVTDAINYSVINTYGGNDTIQMIWETPLVGASEAHYTVNGGSEHDKLSLHYNHPYTEISARLALGDITIMDDLSLPKVHIDVSEIEEFIFQGSRISVDGGSAAEKIQGIGTSNVFLYGHGGNDILTGSSTSFADYLDGGDQSDTLYGLGGSDYLHGGNHSDTIYGGSGNDFLYGEAGTDQLYGGGGIDTFVFGANQSLDTIKDFSTADLLDVSALGYRSFSQLSGRIVVSTSTNTTYIYLDNNTADGGYTTVKLENYVGVNAGDFIFA